MVFKIFRWLILATFLLTGCKTYVNEVAINELISGEVKASQLSDDAICKILQRADVPTVTREMWDRGLDCRKSAQPLVSWQPPNIEENFTIERQYQKNYNVIIPDYKINQNTYIYGNPKQSLEYYKFFNPKFEFLFELKTFEGEQDWFCEKWMMDLEWIISGQTKGLDGTFAWTQGTETDAFVLCQENMHNLALKGLISEEHSKIYQNIIENWVKNNTPKNLVPGRNNFLYLFWMNSVFNGVELLHKNFNWDDKQYLDYADWLRVRTLELFPIERKNERSAYQCKKNIRDGKGSIDRRDTCQNHGALAAAATLRAGIWLKDTKFINQAYLTFHKYMTGIREDGSNIADSSRRCAAADYNLWASEFMSDFIYLWSIIGDSLWNHTSLGMGKPSEAVRYSLELRNNPEMINPYTEPGSNYSDCSKIKSNRIQLYLAPRYPNIFWAPYFFQEENISPIKFSELKNYIDGEDYLRNGMNSEISYIYHHLKGSAKARNAYKEKLRIIEREIIELKKNFIKDSTDLKDHGLKNKKRGLLEKYDTVIQLYALEKNDEYEYPVFIGIEGKKISIDIILPRTKIKSKDAWKPDKNKLKFCKNEFVKDEAIIINVNQIESKKSDIKCILDSFTFEERNIFIKSFEEFINNVKNIFEKSHKESKDENEKKLLNNSLNMIILNKSSISLN